MRKKAHFSVTLFFVLFSLVLLTLGGGGIFYSVKKMYGNVNLLLFGNKTDAKIIGYESNYFSILYTNIRTRKYEARKS